MSLSQTHRTLHIPIVNDMEFEKDENFEIELFDATDGAKVGRVNRTAVTITNDDGKERKEREICSSPPTPFKIYPQSSTR